MRPARMSTSSSPDVSRRSDSPTNLSCKLIGDPLFAAQGADFFLARFDVNAAAGTSAVLGSNGEGLGGGIHALEAPTIAPTAAPAAALCRATRLPSSMPRPTCPRREDPSLRGGDSRTFVIESA